MIDDYGYVTARIRAMRTRLLGRKMFDRLLREATLEDIINVLLETDYAQALTEARASKVSIMIAVETGIARHLRDSFSKVIDMTGGAPRRLLRIIVRRYDLYNLKSIMRAKRAGSAWDEVQKTLFPGFDLSEPLLKELMKQPNLQGIADMLATWRSEYYPTVKASVADLAQTGSLFRMETSLDREYYDRALESLKEDQDEENAAIVTDFLRSEIDTINILTALRCVSQGGIPATDREALFIGGGAEIDAESYNAMMSCPSISAVLEKILTTKYGPALTEAEVKIENPPKLPLIDTIFQRYLGRRAAGLFMKQPVSIGPVFGYLWLKLFEATNVRMICRGKAANLPPKIILEALIFV